MRRAGKSAGGMGRAMKRLFIGFSAFFVIKSAITVIAKFEDTMVTVRGVTRASSEEFERLNKTARDLGASTRFSAAEAGEGLLFLARAGFTVDEAIAALPATLDLALVGMLDLGRASDIASNILSAFRLPAGETVRVVDALTIVSNRSNTNIEQLAEAMKLAAPIAGALGHTVEATAAAIGVLGDSGIQASLAGTNLRGIMGALLGPTGKAQRSIKNLQIELDEVNPAFVSMVDIFRRFRDAGFDATDAIDIFGRRNASAALVLTASVEKMEQLNAATEKYAGESARLAAERAQTLTGRWKALISAVQELFIQIGESGLKGGLKDITDALTATMRASDGLASVIGTALGQALKGIAAGLEKLPALIRFLEAGGLADIIERMNAIFGVSKTVVQAFVSVLFLVADGIDAIAVAYLGLENITNRASQGGGSMMNSIFGALGGNLGKFVTGVKQGIDDKEFAENVKRNKEETLAVLERMDARAKVLGLFAEGGDTVPGVEDATEKVEGLGVAFDDLYGSINRQNAIADAIFGPLESHDALARRLTLPPTEDALRKGPLLDSILSGNAYIPPEGISSPTPDFIIENARKQELANAKAHRKAITDVLAGMREETGVGISASEIRSQVITPLEEATAVLEQLNLLRALGPEQGGISEEEYRRAVEQTNYELLERSTELSAGFERFFIKMADDAANAAAQVEGVLNAAFRSIEGAIADVILQTRSWQDAMRAVGEAIIRELVKVATQLLINITLQAILKGLSIGGGFGFGADTSATAGTVTMAGGAPVALPGASSGGIFEGPESGYPVVLHGTEEVRRVDRASYQPLDGSAQPTAPVVHLKQEFNINAVDNASIDKKVLNSIARSGTQVASMVVGELQRDRSLADATKAVVS